MEQKVNYWTIKELRFIKFYLFQIDTFINLIILFFPKTPY